MVSWAQIETIASALPEVECVNDGRRSWAVRGKGIAWERPLRPKEAALLGDAAPVGDIIAIHVADEGIKQALIAAQPSTFFTIDHFNGYPAVLALRTQLRVADVRELFHDGWRIKAPASLLNLHPEL